DDDRDDHNARDDDDRDLDLRAGRHFLTPARTARPGGSVDSASRFRGARTKFSSARKSVTRVPGGATAARNRPAGNFLCGDGAIKPERLGRGSALVSLPVDRVAYPGVGAAGIRGGRREPS